KCLPIDHNYDYSIEAKIKITNNQNCDGFAIMWGIASSDDFSYWYFSSRNNYNKMVRVKNGIEKPYLPWSSLPPNCMNPRGAYNIIEIKKQKNNITLSVNYNVVATVPNIDYIGTYIGFLLYPDASLEIDQLKVKRRK